MKDFSAYNRNQLVSDIRNLQEVNRNINIANLYLNAENLSINKEILSVNKQTNSLIRLQIDLMQSGLENATKTITSKILSLSLQLKDFSNFVKQKTFNEECENLVREIIFNLKKQNEFLSKIKDKKLIALEAKTILSIIDAFDINTKCFSQIQDKEYFSEIYESLQSKYNAISEEEKNEIDAFSEGYFSTNEGLKILQGIERTKLINFPNEIKSTAKPSWDGILIIEGEILQELKNPYRDLELKGPQLKNWLTNIDDFPILLKNFFDAKKEYEIKNCEFQFYRELQEIKKRNEFYVDFLEKLHKGVNLINTYIQSNQEFAGLYPILNLTNIKETVIDYNSLLNEHETRKIAIENEIQNQYLKYRSLLTEKMNGELPKKTASKKRNKLSVTILLPIFFIILITLIGVFVVLI